MLPAKPGASEQSPRCLCPAAFARRATSRRARIGEDWLHHTMDEHGGLQRYRNALFSMLSLKPYAVTGQEWRAVVGNFSEFFARSAMDWESFTPDMKEAMKSDGGLPPQSRWEPRGRSACVFCARLLWREVLHDVFLAGPHCFMESPALVAELLAWEHYHQHWPDILATELKASAVKLRIGESQDRRLVLLHKRRVHEPQATSDQPVCACEDCYEAFRHKKPLLCKYSLANHPWLGRWDPLFRNANLAHQMLLALARIVTTKVVLRPEGRATSRSGDGAQWDFLFHQSGMIGSAILFGNADAKEALAVFPPKTVNGEFAVSFISKPKESGPKGCPEGSERDESGEAQKEARRVVQGIAKLKVHRAEFDRQAQALRTTWSTNTQSTTRISWPRGVQMSRRPLCRRCS